MFLSNEHMIMIIAILMISMKQKATFSLHNIKGALDKYNIIHNLFFPKMLGFLCH